jgi:guanylate kinase
MNPIIILTGHSGSGKDTVSAALQSTGEFAPIIPHSTRAMRDNESEGNPYHFISDEQFLRMAVDNKFIEHKSYVTQFNGVESIARYGTAFDSIPDNKPSVITIGVLAGLNLKNLLGDRAILIYLDVDDDTREQRAKARGSFDKIEWDNRLAQDHERFKNGLPEGIDHSIDNTKPLETTVNTILNLL